jgi:hypothetical protein
MANSKATAVAETREADWLLRMFVNNANAVGGDFLSITLNVGGLIVSGTLVGASDYYKGISRIFSTEERPKEGTWAALLLKQAETAKFDPKTDGVITPANFIHLRDARLHTNGQRGLPSNEGVWWRGRLDSVDGFWIGRLQGSEP